MSIKKLILTLLFMLSSSLSHAVTIADGESFDFTFTNIAFFGDTTATAGISANFNLFGDELVAGDSLRLELFEDSSADSAFLTTVFSAPGNGFGVGTIDLTPRYWTDLQGAFRLTAISGSVNLDSFTLVVNNNGKQYRETVKPPTVLIPIPSVPELSSFYLFMIGFLGIAVVTVLHRRL